MPPCSYQDLQGTKLLCDWQPFSRLLHMQIISLGLVSAVMKSYQGAGVQLIHKHYHWWGKPHKLKKPCCWWLLYYIALFSYLQIWQLCNTLNPPPEPVIVTKRLSNNWVFQVSHLEIQNLFFNSLVQINYKPLGKFTVNKTQQMMEAYR